MHALWSDVGLALWRLLPANPIVVRVVAMGGKRVGHLAMRGGYLAVLLGVVLVSQMAYSGHGSTLSELAKNSSQVFLMVSVLQLALVCLVAPIFAAGAISQEKDAETFNVLLTTPLSNAQIVLGSLAARMFFVVALLVAGLPIFGITMLFGGVTADQILLSFGVAACTAVLFGAVAILVSVMRVGSRGTILWFYLGVALYLMTGLALGRWDATFVRASIDPATGEGMTWLTLVHPFWALMVALHQVHAPSPAAVTDLPWPLPSMLARPHVAYMILSLLGSAAMVSLATCFVRSGVRQGEPGPLQRLGKRLPFRRVTAGNADRRRRPRRVWANPVAWREAVTRASPASSNLSRYSYLLLGIGVGVTFMYAYGSGRFGSVTAARAWLVWIVLTEIMIVLVMAATAAATAIARERDDGTMELLLSTPLTSRYIIWGKLRGLVSFAAPLMAVPVATVLAVGFYDRVRGASPPIVLLGFAMALPVLLTVYTALVCVVGLHASLKIRRSIQAALMAVGVLMLLAFGLGSCVFAIVNMNEEVAALLLPFTFIASLVYLLDPVQFVTVPVYTFPSTVPPAILIPFWAGTILAAVVYGGIVLLMCRNMVTKFDMIVRKQSE